MLAGQVEEASGHYSGRRCILQESSRLGQRQYICPQQLGLRSIARRDASRRSFGHIARRAKDQASTTPKYWITLGWLYYRKGMYDLAAKELEHALTKADWPCPDPLDGDIVRNIRDNYQWIGHFHTGGNPGRHDIDETQELNYRFIAQAIADLNYTGFIFLSIRRRRRPRSNRHVEQGHRDLRRIRIGNAHGSITLLCLAAAISAAAQISRSRKPASNRSEGRRLPHAGKRDRQPSVARPVAGDHR